MDDNDYGKSGAFKLINISTWWAKKTKLVHIMCFVSVKRTKLIILAHISSCVATQKTGSLGHGQLFRSSRVGSGHG